MDKTLHLLIMYTMLVLMLLLLQKSRKNKRGIFLAAYALIEVLTNGIDSITLWGGTGIYEKFPAILFLSKPITLLWVPLFYFYVESCFFPNFRWNNRFLIHLLPFGLTFSFFLIMRGIKGAPGIAENTFRFGSLENYSLYAIDIMVRLQYLVYNILMIVQLIGLEKRRKMSTNHPDNILNIRWLRFIVYGYAVACTGAIFTFVMFHFNMEIGARINIFSILYFFLFFFIIFYDTITTKPINSKKNVKSSHKVSDEMKGIMEKMDRLLMNDQIYLDPELNLKQLAEMMHEKERTISNAINAVKERNFKDYINSFRIAYSCMLLKKDIEKPVFEVMFESGFNTKGPFHAAFKKITGKTPSEYREGVID